jgi:hypothetical protein
MHTVALVPAVAQKANNAQGCGRQVKNAKVQALGWLFAKLLCCAGTDGTLCFGRSAEHGNSDNQQEQKENFVFHV